VNRHSRDHFGFTLVGNKIIRIAEFLKVKRLCRSRIDNAANATGFGKLHGVVDSTQRNFELQNDGVCLPQQRRRGIYILGESVSLAPFTTMMRFCPLGSTKIGATPLETPSAMRTYVTSIPSDSKFLIVAGPKRSFPTFATISHVRPTQTRRNRLIRPLAPKAEIELRAKDGFARPRKHIIEGGQVHIGRCPPRQSRIAWPSVLLDESDDLRYSGCQLPRENVAQHEP